MSKFSRTLGGVAAVAAVWQVSMGPAGAQESAPLSTGEEEPAIVVTAQKREQILIDVPLSITAITGRELAKRGALAIEDLQYAIPGISMTQLSPGQQRVQMRGVSVFSGLPTVGVYQDEMPLNLEANQTGQDVRLLDINRIEVLRGPQGTLYGQGAVGGTIRYITNDVDLTRAAISGAAEVATIDKGGVDWRGEAMVNVPMVTDQLGLRVAGSYQRFGGWIDNPLSGESNVNSGHALTLRGKLAMVLGDPLKVTIMVQHQELKLGAQNISNEDRQVFDRTPTPYNSRATLANATAEYDFGSATLLSSTGYLERRDLVVQDVSIAIAPIVSNIFGTPPGDSLAISTVLSGNYHVFTQELRLSSSGYSDLNWTLGGFYRDSTAKADVAAVVEPNILPPSFILLGQTGTYPSNSKSWAVFGEASYRLNSAVTALVGLRYFEDKRVQNTASTVFGTTSVDRGRDRFNTLSPRFNLSWQPSKQANLFVNVAKGFRSGGFNVTSAGAGLAEVPPTYAPDTLWSYELGGKFATSDRKLSTEISVYRNEWSDVQTTTNIQGLPLQFTTNGGKIAGWGVDGSLGYSPTNRLTLTVTGGWNNMKYKTDSTEHLVGDRADYVPRYTASIAGEYRFDLGEFPSFVRVDFQHSDRIQLFPRNFALAPVFSDKQNVLNARLGISGVNWDAALFVRNALNRDSVTYPAVGSLIYPARLQPRAVGLSAGLRY